MAVGSSKTRLSRLTVWVIDLFPKRYKDGKREKKRERERKKKSCCFLLFEKELSNSSLEPGSASFFFVGGKNRSADQEVSCMHSCLTNCPTNKN